MNTDTTQNPTHYTAHNMPTSWVCQPVSEADRKKLMENLMNDCDPYKSYYNTAERDLKNVIDFSSKKVTNIKLLCQSCGESSPCCGHGGVVVTYDDSTVGEYDCDSVSIGAIMTYYSQMDGVEITDKHCMKWISDNFKSHLLKTFN
jgi:hypothetical protein